MRNTIRILALVFVAVLALWTLAQAAPEDDAGNAARGRAAYTLYCSSCHGKAGKGDGPVASTLKVPPADLTQLAKSYGGKFPADRVYARIDGRDPVVAHGPSDMPVWGLSFQDPAKDTNQEAMVEGRIHDLVTYLATLQDKTGAR